MARVMPAGRYTELIRAKTGNTIKLSLMLHNPAYGSAQGVRVAIKVVEEDVGCWRVTALASSRVQPELKASFGPVLILTPLRAPALRPQYIASSTRLIDQHSTLIGALPDGVVERGILTRSKYRRAFTTLVCV